MRFNPLDLPSPFHFSKTYRSRIFGWFAAVLCAFQAMNAAWITYDSVSLMVRGKPTQAEIVRFESDAASSTDEKAVLFPVFGYKITTGERIEIRSHTGSIEPLFSVGQRVPIYFDPENPERAVIRYELARAPLVAWIVVGILFLLAWYNLRMPRTGEGAWLLSKD